MSWTIKDVIERLPKPTEQELPTPPLEANPSSTKVLLGVESACRQMTDEVHQLQLGLAGTGYWTYGAGYAGEFNKRDVRRIVDDTDPAVIVMQDKREWDNQKPTRQWQPTSIQFGNYEYLRVMPNIFKVAVVKDTHHRPWYYFCWAQDIGANAWVTYYNPEIVKRTAPYMRAEHIIRTYHTIDPAAIPKFNYDRRTCIITGALYNAYPLRQRLVSSRSNLYQTEYLQHPGYGVDGCAVPQYLKTLNQYKISICTTSIYGYALRKIIESTACGCRVITNLPEDEVMPEIDGNLFRVHPDVTLDEINQTIEYLSETYNPFAQQEFAAKAMQYYDYRRMGIVLANDIDQLRATYVR